ncbi:MAG: ACP S-malonyltransferase [Acidobacteriota bacterium]|nr:ACP S-malonyltransferase [Acidobacteriota bacterium]
MARLVVIAPGRGSYNRTELGYLKRFADHPLAGKRAGLAEVVDAQRARMGRTTISELDNASSYHPRLHLPGENASSLIFTCAAADLAMIDERHDIVATLGNSMGWYIALYAGGALDLNYAFQLIEAMGHFQKDNIIGGQVIYPLVDEEWRFDAARLEEVDAVVEKIRARGPDHWVGLSIRLGGLIILAGTETGVKDLLAELPGVKLGANEYPFQLARHSAFHTHLMRDTSDRAVYLLNNTAWGQPKIPTIDGTGRIWHPHRTDAAALRDYTLVHQVVEPYDFSTSVRVAIREYNPDHLVLLGPGETLGGAIAQVIISEAWRGITSKADFMDAQKSEQPPLLSMNRPDQAQRII